MNQTAIIVAQLLLQHGPAMAKAFQELFTKPNPTQEDWNRVWSLAEESLDKIMNEARENERKL